MKPENRSPNEPSGNAFGVSSLRFSLRPLCLCVENGCANSLRYPSLESKLLGMLKGFDGAPIQTKRCRDRRVMNAVHPDLQPIRK
jgi:hypothetical protein